MAEPEDLQERLSKLREAFGDIDTAVTKYASLATDLRKTIRDSQDLLVFSPYVTDCLKLAGGLSAQLRQASHGERMLFRIEANIRAERLEKERQERKLASDVRRKAKSTVSNAAWLPPADNSFDEIFSDDV